MTIMTLEEKFKKHIEKLQNNHFTVAIPKLIHDLAKIAQEGQEVIAEGELKYDENIDKHYIGGTEIYIDDVRIFGKVSKLNGKKVRITLETIE